MLVVKGDERTGAYREQLNSLEAYALTHDIPRVGIYLPAALGNTGQRTRTIMLLVMQTFTRPDICISSAPFADFAATLPHRRHSKLRCRAT